MWLDGLRESVSLLQSQGHPEARFYPVPRLWTETRIAKRRLDRALANEAVLIQMAASSLFSEKAGKNFEKRIKELMGK